MLHTFLLEILLVAKVFVMVVEEVQLQFATLKQRVKLQWLEMLQCLSKLSMWRKLMMLM
jgi:hypothetical protein